MHCKMKCWKIGPLVVLGIAVLGWVVMALWNWLLPTLFGIKEISYVQAMGVLLLSKILFGGFRGHCGGHANGRTDSLAAKYALWQKYRMENMTPEEREKFQAGMRSCCGKRKDEAAETKE